MEGLAVATERFAVVAGDDPIRRPRAEGGDQPADQRIGGGDLSRVEVVRVLGAERLRRIVGIVRFEEVDPTEERCRRRQLLDPLDRRFHGLAARPLGRGQVPCFEIVVQEAIEVVVEASAEPESSVEHERADESAGPVACSV